MFDLDVLDQMGHAYVRRERIKDLYRIVVHSIFRVEFLFMMGYNWFSL
jgi:hypothetical protein